MSEARKKLEEWAEGYFKEKHGAASITKGWKEATLTDIRAGILFGVRLGFEAAKEIREDQTWCCDCLNVYETLEDFLKELKEE